MTKEFNQINAFINEIVDQNKLNATEPELENHRINLKGLFVNLQDRLEEQILEQAKQEKLILFIHYTQAKLTTLADSLPYKIKTSDIKNYGPITGTQQILDEVCIKIVKVLEHLHLYFASNFDCFTNLPTCFFRINDHNVKEHELIISALAEKNIDINLVSILKAYFNCLVEPCDFNIKTWHQYDYLIDFSNHVRHFSKQLPSEDDTFKLILLLISHNFNSAYFYNFMLDFIEKKINKDTIYEEQETKLIDLLKVIENLRQEDKYGFNPNVPVIQESLSASIKRDLERITQLKTIYLQDIVKGGGKSKDFYFEVAGTIEDLLFILRLLMDLGLIKTKFKASLYTFIEHHIKTERTRTPSAHYMRNIFSPSNEVSPRIVKKSKTTLMSIIDYISIHFRDQLKFCLAVVFFKQI